MRGWLYWAYSGPMAVYLGAPNGQTCINPQDLLILYGRANNLSELDSRQANRQGDAAHQNAMAKQKQVVSRTKPPGRNRPNQIHLIPAPCFPAPLPSLPPLPDIYNPKHPCPKPSYSAAPCSPFRAKTTTCSKNSLPLPVLQTATSGWGLTSTSPWSGLSPMGDGLYGGHKTFHFKRLR